MNSFKKVLFATVITVAFLTAGSSFAGDPIRKFGRGICGVGFGALEIPIAMSDTQKEEGGIASVTYGAMKGFARFIAREFVGVTEIVTFAMPLPNCPDDPRDAGWGYGPIMTPEWIVDTEHNYYSIFYNDTAVMDK